MRLAEVQTAMGELLLQPAGHGILSNPDRWNSFLETESGQVFKGFSREIWHLYEELLYTSVEDTLQSLFPFCYQLLIPEWASLVERYRREYPNPSFQLFQCAAWFPQFIEQQTSWVTQYPFLPNLAQYEWREVEILNAVNPILPEGCQPQLPAEPDAFLSQIPVWNPVHYIGSFDYPLPEIIQEIQRLEEVDSSERDLILGQLQTVTPQPTNLLIYREPNTLEVRFFQLNPLTAAVISQSTPNTSYLQLFQTLWTSQAALQQIPFEQVLVEGMKLLQTCFERGILLGSAPVLQH